MDAPLRIHDVDGSVEAFCLEHAPVRLAVQEDLAALEAAFAGGRRDPEGLYELAVARLRAGDAAGAAVAVAEITLREPRRVAALELLADCEEALGRLDEALALQARACEAAPNEGERHARLARLHAQAGAMEAALARYEAGAAADPFHWECLRRAAVLRLARGEAEAAAALLEGFLAHTTARAAEVVQVRADRPALTSRDLGSRLALEERERVVAGRRSHEVAAARFGARRLLAAALGALDRRGEAEEMLGGALAELDGVPDVLLVEVAAILGEDAEAVRVAVASRRGGVDGAG